MLLALIAMIVATLAHHLGLSEAIARVIAKIAGCPKCLSFWVVLIVLLLSCIHPVIALTLAIVSAYISNWIGLLLMLLAKIYNRIWERINRV
jgi:uncharacterized membrane protein YecN with MAPEG domain